MISGLAIVVRKGTEALKNEYVFDRVPVLVGRDQAVVGLCLADPSVSRVHASLDVRDGAIWARDARSTNGTLFGGARISTKWVQLGDLNGKFELVVGAFHLEVRGYEIERRSMTETSGSAIDLATVFGDEEIAELRQPVPPVANTSDLTEAVNRWLQGRKALRSHIQNSLRTVAGPQRVALIEAWLRKHPSMRGDVELTALLAQTSNQPAGASQSTESESAALAAIQQLANWYLGAALVPNDPIAIRAFQDKLRSALDEFMLGYVPLVGSMSQLTRELALDKEPVNSARQPKTPADFARRLLNWQDPSDSASKAVRESFSEVVVHQAGMLNGVMRGVQALLDELAPAAIEAILGKKESKAGLLGRAFGARERELWELFKLRYADLADEEQEQFRILFGKEFAEEYLQFTGESKAYKADDDLNKG